jgi:hypothetical protein
MLVAQNRTAIFLPLNERGEMSREQYLMLVKDGHSQIAFISALQSQPSFLVCRARHASKQIFT